MTIKAKVGDKETKHSCELPFTRFLLSPRFWLTWVSLGLVFILSLMPQVLRHYLGRSIGNITYRRNKKRRDIVLTNIKIAFPELDLVAQQQLAKQHLQWYGCALVDYSLLLFASKRRLKKIVTIEGSEHIEAAIKQNQSVMILLAHSVMLEFAPIALSFHYTCYGSYKSAKNPVMNWLIAKSRCRYVKFVVSRDQGLRKLIRELIPKQLLIFLPDEDLGKKNAVFAPFFGKAKATLTTPSRIATLAKAASLPCFSYYDQNTKNYKVVIAPPIEDYPSKDTQKNAQKLNQQLERLIRQHPAQYMWLMKLYRTRPDKEKAVY
ncbi:MAG: lysophospholipid acyltransferase family protein [Cocleimonas sp.]|nr:lysophospholipid acyltransferase family protein [Cocleimonas sp.]